MWNDWQGCVKHNVTTTKRSTRIQRSIYHTLFFHAFCIALKCVCYKNSLYKYFPQGFINMVLHMYMYELLLVSLNGYHLCSRMIFPPGHCDISFLHGKLGSALGSYHSCVYPVTDLTLLENHQFTSVTRRYQNVILILAVFFCTILESCDTVSILFIIVPLTLQCKVFSSNSSFSNHTDTTPATNDV